MIFIFLLAQEILESQSLYGGDRRVTACTEFVIFFYSSFYVREHSMDLLCSGVLGPEANLKNGSYYVRFDTLQEDVFKQLGNS